MDSHLPVPRHGTRHSTLDSRFFLPVPFVAAAALLTIALMGPTTLASMNPSWALAFLVSLAAVTVWWAGYLWLLARLSGWVWQRGLSASLCPLGLLSLSLLPGLGVLLSGKLPYTLTFDPSTQSLYRWVAASLLGAAVVAQELILLQVARGEDLVGLAAGGARRAARLPGWLAGLPGGAVRQARLHPALAVVLAVGTVPRLVEIGAYHAGDMNVILSAVYATLTWPPFGYYQAYRPQPWVYNHLPLFPFMVAPLYWLFENALHFPTAWAAKLLIDVADLVIAVLLYRQVRGRWQRTLGLALAAAWLLNPGVLISDDHPIAPAVAFALAAFASLGRGWLCGLLLALAVATRTEAAFLVLPVVVHFATRRGLGQSVAFLGAFATTLALVVAPFALYDPESLDYALRRQIQRDAATGTSMVAALLLPHLAQGPADWLQRNSTVLAVGLNLLIAPLAARDRRVLRVVVVAAAAYLLVLPIVFPRYTLFALAAGLFYAARYRNPLVGGVALAAAWPEFGYGPHALVGLFGGLGLSGLLWPEKGRRTKQDVQDGQDG